MDHLLSLRREEHEDGVQQADEGEGGDDWNKLLVVKVRGGEKEEGKAGHDRGSEGDAEEDADRGRDGGVGDADGGGAVGVKDSYEQQRQRCKKDDLKEGVDRHEDGAVVVAAVGLFIVSITVWDLRREGIITRLFQIKTIAIHLATPTRINPCLNPSSSGKNAHDKASMNSGATTQFTTMLKASCTQTCLS